jgi:hypothetical protein
MRKEDQKKERKRMIGREGRDRIGEEEQKKRRV